MRLRLFTYISLVAHTNKIFYNIVSIKKSIHKIYRSYRRLLIFSLVSNLYHQSVWLCANFLHHDICWTAKPPSKHLWLIFFEHGCTLMDYNLNSLFTQNLLFYILNLRWPYIITIKSFPQTCNFSYFIIMHWNTSNRIIHWILWYFALFTHGNGITHPLMITIFFLAWNKR